MKRRVLSTTVGLAAAAALLVPASAANAQVTNEALVSFVGPKKLKVGKRVTYSFVCSVNCNVEIRDVLKGPKFKDVNTGSGGVPGGQVTQLGFKPNGPLLQRLKDDTGKFKLALTITATDPATGAVDKDSRVYKFK